MTPGRDDEYPRNWRKHIGIGNCRLCSARITERTWTPSTSSNLVAEYGNAKHGLCCECAAAEWHRQRWEAATALLRDTEGHA